MRCCRSLAFPSPYCLVAGYPHKLWMILCEGGLGRGVGLAFFDATKTGSQKRPDFAVFGLERPLCTTSLPCVDSGANLGPLLGMCGVLPPTPWRESGSLLVKVL